MGEIVLVIPAAAQSCAGELKAWCSERLCPLLQRNGPGRSYPPPPREVVSEATPRGVGPLLPARPPGRRDLSVPADEVKLRVLVRRFRPLAGVVGSLVASEGAVGREKGVVSGCHNAPFHMACLTLGSMEWLEGVPSGRKPPPTPSAPPPDEVMVGLSSPYPVIPTPGRLRGDPCR